MQVLNLIDDKTIKVTDESGTEELISDRLFINTGAESTYQILMA